MDYIPYKRWLHQHDEDIKQDFQDRPTEAMAQDMDLNYYTVSRRATRLGVGKSSAFMHTSWKKGGNKKGGWKKTSERKKDREVADTYLCKHFANTKNDVLAARFGVDVKTIRRWARKLGLVKDKEFMSKCNSSGKKGKSFYTPEQIAWRNQRIADVYPDADNETLQRLANELGVGVGRIHQIANSIGVVRIHKPPQYLDELAEYFPTHTDKDCAARFGIKTSHVQWFARKHGWKKTESHIRKMYDSNITAAHNANRKNRP